LDKEKFITVNYFDNDPSEGLYQTYQKTDFYSQSNLCLTQSVVREKYINGENNTSKYRKCKGVLICDQCDCSKPHKSGCYCGCGGKLNAYGKDCQKKSLSIVE
jgi:hypothetical protein